MNGMLNTNFVVGMLLARDLSRQEQFLTGLAAGQMPASSPIGPIVLKQLTDGISAAEAKRSVAEASAETLRRPIEIELPIDVEAATVRVPGVTDASFALLPGSSPGVVVDARTGAISLPDEGNEGTVAVTFDGVVRQVTFRRGARATFQTTAGRVLSQDELAAISEALVALLSGAVTNARETDSGVAATPRAAPAFADRQVPAAREMASQSAAASGTSGPTKERATGRRGEAQASPADLEKETGTP